MRVIEVSGSFGDSQESMHIVRVGKHRARDFPGRYTFSWDEPNDSSLPFTNRAQVAIKKFFIVTNRFAVASINQGGREASHAREADQILRQRSKTSCGVDRIWSEDRIGCDPLKHAIAGDDRTVRFANK